MDRIAKNLVTELRLLLKFEIKSEKYPRAIGAQYLEEIRQSTLQS
jgi:hypothetical protein